MENLLAEPGTEPMVLSDSDDHVNDEELDVETDYDSAGH